MGCVSQQIFKQYFRFYHYIILDFLKWPAIVNRKFQQNFNSIFNESSTGAIFNTGSPRVTVRSNTNIGSFY